MIDHSPPADAVEAGQGAWTSRRISRRTSEAVLSAAHAAGTIRWESELRAAVERGDEAVARASMMLMHSRFVECGNVGCTYHVEDYDADAAAWDHRYQTASAFLAREGSDRPEPVERGQSDRPEPVGSDE